MRSTKQNPQKPRKLLRKSAKINTLSLYCITLSLICQVFGAFLGGFSENVSATSTANRFYFQDFAADYYLSRDEDGTSRLKVVETLVAVFPTTDQNHGITRVIPYTNQNGKNLTMASDDNLDIQIKHNGIVEEPYDIESGDGYFTVYIGSPSLYVHDRQIYELEYEFENVITNPSDNPGIQELYWDTNGNDWSQRFNNLTARVHLIGEEVQAAFNGNVFCYVGKYGAKGDDRCQIRSTSDGFEFHATDLAAGENLTFDFEFVDDTFAIPSRVYDYRLVGAIVVELIVAGILLVMIMATHAQTKTKRAYYNGLFVKPEYTPPAGFTVAEMDLNYVGRKSILGSNEVATLLELAVTHKIELAKVGTEKHPQWTVKTLSTDLSAEQTDLLKLIIGRDAELETGQEVLIKTHDYDKALARLKEKYSTHIKERLLAAGLLEADKAQTGNTTKRTPSKANLCDALSVSGILWTIISLVALPFLVDGSIPSYVTLYGGGWLIALMIILAIAIATVAFWASSHYRKFYTHTQTGLEMSRYLDGLKLYIKMAEQDRIKFLQSVDGVDTSNQGIVNLYEKLLPYAVIFHLETSWLNEMAKYYELNDVSMPTWYVGGTMFSARDFTTAVHSISNNVEMNVAHSTTSDSSSSFSGGSSGSGGGGFSGGGGGAGGGGGW